MSFATIEDLRSQLGGGFVPTPEYRAKQLHPLPKAETVDREKFILKHCQGKRVLEFGASGKLHEAIKGVAASVLGVDRQSGDGILGFDLDDVSESQLPWSVDEGGSDNLLNPDIIICGEVLEHLGNPLHFLTRLKKQYAGVPVILTVPNAYAAGSAKWLAQGIENVNADHVAWYSPKTLSVLLTRAGYTVGGLFYYNGQGPTAEGLVVVTE